MTTDIVGGMGDNTFDEARYPMLRRYVDKIRTPNREIIGREAEQLQIRAAMERPELSNVLLLAPAGAGKTALVQATMMADDTRDYYEVDLARMIANLSNADEMAHRLKTLFDEVIEYIKEVGREIVLFIDEAHQVVQLSAAAVEALKPILASSGTLGIRVIMATTFEEYNQFIKPNQPLDQRLQRITLTPPDTETTVKILRGMAVRYGVDNLFPDDRLLYEMCDLTERYQPSDVQPRKSIKLLDAMVGWHRATKKPMDMNLLAEVLRLSTGINVAFHVDGRTIKDKLNERVFAQELATDTIARRLQLCVADLHNKHKPQASFLFSGATGVGKTEMAKALALLLFGDDRNRLIRFDMSEFSLDDTLQVFRSELSRQVSNMGHAILLFDEIEKASLKVVRVLLQVLDDGRLTDDNGRQVSFLNTYIILTTNAGHEIFRTIGRYSSSDTGDGQGIEDYMKNIETSIRETAGFPPELLGRIDEIVPFQPLSEETQRKIVVRKLKALRDDVRMRHGIRLRIDDAIIRYITIDKMDTDTVSGGARNAVRTMEREVATEVAEFINAYPGDREIQVYVEGEMRADNKNRRKSGAKVAVRRVEH